MFLKTLTLRDVLALLAVAMLGGLFGSGAIALPLPADLGQFAIALPLPADLGQFAILGALGATKLVQARVLVDFPLEGLRYKCDQVVKLPSDVAKALQDSGMLDTDKGAVEYALGLNNGQVLTHETETERAAAAARTAQQAVVDELADKVATETDAATLAALRAELDAATQALAALG